MPKPPIPISYDATEEHLNVISHGFGALIALIASIVLLTQTAQLALPQWLGIWVYCASLILMLSSSTLYHWSKTEQKRHWYKKLDHIAIYYLIAGTYTPFLSIQIPTAKAHYLLIALWLIAAIGTIFKLGFAHRFGKFSLAAYLLMGWFAILMMDDMRHYLATGCLRLLVIGGLFYSIGAIFYALKNIRYTHAIWHIFVLLGAGAHFLAIFWYI
ncbi:PAQR family membrane homeostasis protein TrhA [Acinetobacter sp. MD2(2019)]|uniref:PAQR family membrane homeostasis protein TrhA n=1 Tax=Acinetobacter sp. MD2(2019) TaxID=2605273 RepID=UPI002D1F650B|nr:hemolysin III family protein [Acinetobacter sp. MD2(2019)]MEB3753665.1 hemolysin III family protein [Acinetobacter sp. MD2(2019)]